MIDGAAAHYLLNVMRLKIGAPKPVAQLTFRVRFELNLSATGVLLGQARQLVRPQVLERQATNRRGVHPQTPMREAVARLNTPSASLRTVPGA